MSVSLDKSNPSVKVELSRKEMVQIVKLLNVLMWDEVSDLRRIDEVGASDLKWHLIGVLDSMPYFGDFGPSDRV